MSLFIQQPALKLLSAALMLVLSACQQLPATQDPLFASTLLLQDSEFKPVETKVETEEEIFALPPAVIALARQQVLPNEYADGRSLALLTFIFGNDNVPLEYVNSATLIASETYARKEANCLSLTILAYSLAQHLGFEAHFQDVEVPEYWVTRSGNSMLNGHVNLMIYPGKIRDAGQYVVLLRGNGYLIDFDMVPERARQQAKRISKQAIVAMFYNNKAADAIAIGDYDVAYHYLKAAVTTAPQLAQNWNNLAVLYRKKELLSLAEQVYLHSLQLEPEHTNTMSNLAMLYAMTGREQEAAVLEEKVEKKRRTNPYYFIMQGNEALEFQAADDAIQHFRRSLKLQPHVPEAYFGLARSYLLKQDLAKASYYLQAAKRYTDSATEQRRYQYKLDMLNAVARQD